MISVCRHISNTSTFHFNVLFFYQYKLFFHFDLIDIIYFIRSTFFYVPIGFVLRRSTLAILNTRNTSLTRYLYTRYQSIVIGQTNACSYILMMVRCYSFSIYSNMYTYFFVKPYCSTLNLFQL